MQVFGGTLQKNSVGVEQSELLKKRRVHHNQKIVIKQKKAGTMRLCQYAHSIKTKFGIAFGFFFNNYRGAICMLYLSRIPNVVAQHFQVLTQQKYFYLIQGIIYIPTTIKTNPRQTIYI